MTEKVIGRNNYQVASNPRAAPAGRSASDRASTLFDSFPPRKEPFLCLWIDPSRGPLARHDPADLFRWATGLLRPSLV